MRFSQDRTAVLYRACTTSATMPAARDAAAYAGVSSVATLQPSLSRVQEKAEIAGKLDYLDEWTSAHVSDQWAVDVLQVMILIG